MEEYDLDANEFYDLNRSLRSQVNGLLRDYSKLKAIIKSSETASNRLAENLKPLEVKFQNLQGLTSKLFNSMNQSTASNSGDANKTFVNKILEKFINGSRATGGNVSSAGSYIVGERGPELFTPSASGSISANNLLAKNSRAINVTMNISTPDISSFQKSESQILAKLAQRVKKTQ